MLATRDATSGQLQADEYVLACHVLPNGDSVAVYGNLGNDDYTVYAYIASGENQGCWQVAAADSFMHHTHALQAAYDCAVWAVANPAKVQDSWQYIG